MIHLNSHPLLFSARKKTAKANQTAPNQPQNSISAPRSDQFERSVPQEQPGQAFTEEVYDQVMAGINLTDFRRYQGRVNQSKALADTLRDNPALDQRFDIGNASLFQAKGYPSVVMIMPKPNTEAALKEMLNKLSENWVDAPLPKDTWILDIDRPKKIYCTNDANDVKALRKLHRPYIQEFIRRLTKQERKAIEVLETLQYVSPRQIPDNRSGEQHGKSRQ